MDLSFNSDDDLDLIKEIESLSDITNDTNQKNTTTQPKDTKTENITTQNNPPKTENQKTPRRKRRTPTKRNLTPKFDLDALLGPSEFAQNNDNNDFLDLSPREENLFSSPKASIESSDATLSLLEERVVNYANKAFQKLKEDIIFELKSMFEDNFHFQNIIYTFLMSILSDIRNQIRFIHESVDISQIEMDFDLDIDCLNLQKNSMKSIFAIHPIIEQISELKSSFAQNIKKGQINLNQEIQSRDSEISSNHQSKNSEIQYVDQLYKKDFQMQKKLLELNFSLELYEKYNASLRHKFEDLEITEILNQQKANSTIEILQSLEQLKDEIKSTNLSLENKRLFGKMKQIIDEKNELQQISNALGSTTKYFNDFYHKALYNISNYNNYNINHSQSLSIQYTPSFSSNDQNERHFTENKSDFLYTQSDLPNTLNTMNYNMKIPNYI